MRSGSLLMSRIFNRGVLVDNDLVPTKPPILRRGTFIFNAQRSTAKDLVEGIELLKRGNHAYRRS